jgi:Phage integrase family
MRKKNLHEQFRQVLAKAGLLIPRYEMEFKQRIQGKRRLKKVTRYKYYFHTLRHSYATYLLEKGVDLYTISHLLGHNQVTTTQIYARISEGQKNKAIDAAFNAPLRSRILPVHEPHLNEKILEIKKLELEVRKMEMMDATKSRHLIVLN